MPSNDPNYQKRYMKQHYAKNKDYYKDKARERNKRLHPKLKAFVDRYKLFIGCVDCGYKDHAVALHFDHVKGEKFKDVSRMVRECYSLPRIKDEIRKCEVRCANCHMVVTHDRRSS